MVASIVTNVFGKQKIIFKRFDTFCVVLRHFSTKNNPFPKLQEKLIKVAILGTPNAGKSTLINKITERLICPASCKVHTTKTSAKAICNDGNTQIVFLDTPGVVNEKTANKYNLSKSMHQARSSLAEADIIGVLHDVSNPFLKHKLDRTVIDLVKQHSSHTPSFLMLNKIDLLKSKQQLLDMINILCQNTISGQLILPNKRVDESKGYNGFSDVFMVSALDSDGLDTVKEYLIKNAKPSKWLYSTEHWTDKSPQVLIVEAVRAKLLDFLPQEIPYLLNSTLDHYEETEDTIITIVTVECPTEKMRKLIVGVNNGRWRQITDKVKISLRDMFQKQISVVLNIVALNKK